MHLECSDKVCVEWAATQVFKREMEYGRRGTGDEKEWENCVCGWVNEGQGRDNAKLVM